MDDRSLQVRGCSVRKFTGIVALWFAVILVGTDALAADFTESFEDQDFIDLTNLTANLSVEEQAVYLAWSNSQQHRLPDSNTPGTAIGSDTDYTISVVLGDVDGDGHLDLVAGNNGQPNKLYLNDGSGGFPGINTPGTAIGSETDTTFSVVLGDVDGDGDLDLVAGNEDQFNKLYLNDGSGGFAGTGTAIGSETEYTYSVILGDVDGDGDLDLVAGNFGLNKLYLNDGSGGFASTGTAIGSDTDADNTWAVVLGDVDGDGDLDLVAGNSAQPNKLYLNDGSGGVCGVPARPSVVILILLTQWYWVMWTVMVTLIWWREMLIMLKPTNCT